MASETAAGSADEGNEFPVRWNAVVDRQFDGDSLMALLVEYAQQLKEGTFISEFAKVLERERRKNLPMTILQETMTEVPQTVRIDGIMPFRIPLPVNISEPVLKLLEEVGIMGYDVPDGGEELMQLCHEISVCLLADLHRREVQVEHRLMMRMQLECPYSPNVGRANSLMLMGHLPFGGRVTLFYTSLNAIDWLAIDPAAVEYEDHLGAIRQADGIRIADTKDKRPKVADRIKIF
ncbi:MAG: hypothetical protein ACI9R3_004903 [Verrucomicrobiales bacterium]|jgi:hypothetical protein